MWKVSLRRLVNSPILLPMCMLSKHQIYLGEGGDLVTSVARWGTSQVSAGAREAVTNELVIANARVRTIVLYVEKWATLPGNVHFAFKLRRPVITPVRETGWGSTFSRPRNCPRPRGLTYKLHSTNCDLH